MYRPLFIYVEGVDDQRFIERVIKPLMEGMFNPIIPVTCANRPAKEIREHINSTLRAIRANGGEYLYLLDKDEKPCITETKTSVIDYRRITNVDTSRVIVVVKKIEGWYLAGEPLLTTRLRLASTETVDKDKFRRCATQLGWTDIRDYKLSLLADYDHEKSRTFNPSLDYFLRRLEAVSS